MTIYEIDKAIMECVDLETGEIIDTEQLGISQKELAEKVGISQSFLCDIEQGRSKPSIDTAIKIAQVLNVADIKFFEAE